MKAVASPVKDPSKSSDEAKEKEKDWQADQRIKVVDLEALPSQLEGNAAIKCGDWLHRISPTISNLSRRAGAYWKTATKTVQERYQSYLEATPLKRLNMTFDEKEEETSEEFSKVRSVIAEMILKAIPKDLAAEAITKRYEEPMKILLMII